MKMMKRRVQALILAVVMIVTGVLANFTPATEVKAADKTSVTIHYQRANSDYDGWNLWLWPTDPAGNGVQVDFSGKDSFGKVAKYEFDSEVSEVGFIVRKGNWEEKDIEADRTAAVKDGNLEIWLIQGDEKVYTEKPESASKDDADKDTEASMPAKTTVIIHYNRPDGEYDGWNVWGWPVGAEGGQYDFAYEDSYGKVAAILIDKDGIDQVGFIVRKGNWEDKDVSDDRMVDVKDGFAEVWLESAKADVITKMPAGAEKFDLSLIASGDDKEDKEPEAPAEGDVQVNLHYHRYDDIYDGWNIWFWPEGGDGAKYEFTSKDDFGVVATYNFPASAGKIGFIVKLNEWDQKDCDADRVIDLSLAKKGVIDVYLVQSDMTIYTDIDDVDLSPKFLGASLTTAKRIACKVTVPLDTANAKETKKIKVYDMDGNQYPIMNYFSTTDSEVTSSFNINMEEELDLGKQYIIKSKNYGDINVAFGSVFSSADFESAYTYDGDDLGSTWSKDSTTFKVWSPTATKVDVKLYDNGTDGDAYQVVEMTKGEKGVWSATVEGDLNKVYYTYAITNNGVEKEACDLYARTTGVNGKRAMVIDLSSTNPDGWDDDKRPSVIKNATDAMVYEMHVRDFSIDSNSGVKNPGKYLALTEKGTVNKSGKATCLDHLVELGITHVQVMPMYDYSPNSVDESRLETAQFNWGYDPYNYNVPEGSYSTDPFNGEVRVNEAKQMIQSLHNENIGVIMDVVYNHTAENENSWFNITVPDYYYRLTDAGKFSNASGCGNETASERSMVRKYIVDSVVYWATEYHIDGFRFDLMGILDIETMNAVRAALNEIDPTILVYGEGWTGGDSTLAASSRAMKVNTYLMEGVGAFSDDIRDGIKGSVFDAADKGFVSGKEGQEERIKAGVIGATDFKGISWSSTGTDIQSCWTSAPIQAINYVSCHDNLTLWDKINSSNAEDSMEDKIKMNKLSAAIVYTAQGVPFILSGEEILRSKVRPDGTFEHNSYKSSDEVNAIKWDSLDDENVADVYEYYKGLIAFRKNHSGLRMDTLAKLEDNIKFVNVDDTNVVAYTIDNNGNDECSDMICVVYNANNAEVSVKVPAGDWKVCVEDAKAGTDVIREFNGDSVKVSPISCLVMVQGAVEDTTAGDKNEFPWMIVVIIGAAVVLLIIVIIVLKKKKSKKAASAASFVNEAAGATTSATTSAVANDTEAVTGANDGVYDIKLVDAGDNPEVLANTIKELTNISEEQAMDMINNTPKVIMIATTKEEAEEVRAKLEAAGAKITLE